MRRLLPALYAVALAAAPLAARAAAPPGPPPALVVMLKPPPRTIAPRLWRSAFAARAGAVGLRVRDTLDLPGVPWTLRVVRTELDGLRLAGNAGASTGAPGREVVHDLAALARRVEADPAVAWAEPDVPRSPAWTVDDSLPPEPLLADSRQWGLYNVGPDGAYGGTLRADIHAPEAWRIAAGRARQGSHARLAVADTGIDPGHPEFADPATGAPRVALALPIADPAGAVYDSLGHGTMVTAVMAASIGEGAHFDSLGMAGTCGDCDLVALRITRGAQSIASSFDIARAILVATGAGARAMNLSFAGGGRSRLERLALAYAIAHGTVVVAASGNRGYTEPWRLMYPAAYAADGLCIATGASDMWDGRALFSSYGPHLDLVAPGLDIWSAWMTYPAATGVTYPGYVAGSGTSFAAPFATGAIGLLATARPDLMAADFQPLLTASADDVGAPGRDDETGAGRLNAATALTMVAPGIGLWHDEAAAGAWRADSTGTLVLGEDGPGAFTRAASGLRATRFACETRIPLPDSFAAGARAWPRVSATTTLRAGFEQSRYAPWCEARVEDRTLVLNGWAFRIDPDEAAAGTPEDDLWVPLPPDQMRFGFTVLGPVRRATAGPASAVPPRLALRPNPASGPVSIDAPGPGTVTVFDIRGAIVWRTSVGPGKRAAWPGRDALGRTARPGVYSVRFEGDGPPRVGRLVWVK